MGNKKVSPGKTKAREKANRTARGQEETTGPPQKATGGRRSDEKGLRGTNIPPRADKGQNGRNKRQGDEGKGPETPTRGQDRPDRAIISDTGGHQRPQDNAGRTRGHEAIQTIRRGQRDARGAKGAAGRRRENPWFLLWKKKALRLPRAQDRPRVLNFFLGRFVSPDQRDRR